MQAKEKLQELEQNQTFLDWQKENPDSYLVHIFRMLDKQNENTWQFGYYNKDDTITTFFLKPEGVEEMPQQEIFKKDDHKVQALDLEKVELSFKEAVQECLKIHEEKYKQHPVMKTIAILQTLEGKQMYNITFVTQTFHTLNIHLDASDKSILDEKLTSLMDIAEFQKGNKKDKPNYIG